MREAFAARLERSDCKFEAGEDRRFDYFVQARICPARHYLQNTFNWATGIFRESRREIGTFEIGVGELKSFLMLGRE